MIRLIRISGLCGILTVGLLSGLEVSNRLTNQWVLPVEPVEEARKLASQHRWAEAKVLAQFVKENPGTGDAKAAADLAARADKQLNSFWRKARSFGRGAATGEPTDTSSFIGSLTLDFFMIGDVRDIAVQGWKEMRSGEGDTIILALSATGLATTLAPQIDWAPALLKAFKRTGALTRGFLRSLKDASRTALKKRKFGSLQKMVSDVGQAAKNLGPGPLRGTMRSVRSRDDLAKVAAASEIRPKGTYAIARLFENRGVKRISKDGKNVSKIVSSIRTGSRVAKIGKKMLGIFPTLWLVILAAVSALIVGGTLSRRCRPALRRGT